MILGSQVFGGSIFSVASVDSTIVYLINTIQRESYDLSCLQGFDLVAVNLQAQFPHICTFSVAGKRFFFGSYEDHLLKYLKSLLKAGATLLAFSMIGL